MKPQPRHSTELAQQRWRKPQIWSSPAERPRDDQPTPRSRRCLQLLWEWRKDDDMGLGRCGVVVTGYCWLLVHESSRSCGLVPVCHARTPRLFERTVPRHASCAQSREQSASLAPWCLAGRSSARCQGGGGRAVDGVRQERRSETVPDERRFPVVHYSHLHDSRQTSAQRITLTSTKLIHKR